MMAITTNSSIKVKPRVDRGGKLGFLIEMAFPEECLDDKTKGRLRISFHLRQSNEQGDTTLIPWTSLGGMSNR